MSQDPSVKVSGLPIVVAANILETDYLPGVFAGITSRVTIADIRAKLGIQLVFNVQSPTFGASPAASAAANFTAMQAALTAAGNAGRGTVLFPDGDYAISDELLPSSNTTIVLGAGVKIRQTTASKNIFKVVTKDNVWIHCNKAVLYGEGTWSNAWVGVTGHEDRGIQFLGCTNSGATFPRIRNCGLAGIVILGGSNIDIVCPSVEGTHALSTPLAPGNSYQFGYLVMHDTVYGAYDNVRLIEPIAFNVNFGVNAVMNVVSQGSLQIISPRFYSIIGQHGAYLGCNNVNMPNAQISACGLDGIKIYSGVANEQLSNVTIPNFNISNCPNGQAIEFGVSGTGYVSASHVSGVATGCARAVTMDGDVRGCSAVVRSANMGQRALYVSGATGPTDCSWDIESDSTVDKGAYISSATSDRNTLRFKGKNCSTGGGGHWMVGVNACAGLVIERLEARDLLGNMLYGLYVEVGGLNVRIACTPVIKGYTGSGIRSDAISTEWHGSGGDFTSLITAFAQTGNNIVPFTPLKLGRTTTINANVPIWQLTMDDESVYIITLKLIGKVAGSAERRVIFATAGFWRDAAGVATQQGATAVLMDVASAGFVGTYSFTPTVNDVRVLINSAAATTVDWIAEVSVMKKSP